MGRPVHRAMMTRRTRARVRATLSVKPASILLLTFTGSGWCNIWESMTRGAKCTAMLSSRTRGLNPRDSASVSSTWGNTVSKKDFKSHKTAAALCPDKTASSALAARSRPALMAEEPARAQSQ